MKKLPLLLLLTLLVPAGLFAQRPQKVIGAGTGGANFRVPYHQPAGSVRTLSSDTVYVLSGWYFVDSTAKIVIQPGTLILGDSASGGTLIVRRGAKIDANGTAAQPIVFTSAKAPGTRRPGDWGGVILLGNAPTNKPTTQQIEGGFGSIPNTDAQYGGPDAADSSGVFRYVRIEFAGIAFATDNEINGLTFGGVGARTAVDHVQVSFANDDDYEFFGGTVQAKYLIGWRSLDDTFDTDFGFSGKLQFIYTKRDPNIFDASASGSSNGFESDNEGSSPYNALPRTSVKISNATIIGPAIDSAAALALNPKWDNTAMLRRATELSIFNSVLVGWQKGLHIRDTLTQRAAIDGRLQIRNTSLAAPRNVLQLSSSPNTGNISGFDLTAWYNTAGWGNLGSTARQSLDVGLTADAFMLGTANNPVPAATSELATAGTSYGGRLSGDAWFIPVSYRGAFDPSLPRNQQWDAGWANYDPQNTTYLTAVKEQDAVLPGRFTLEQNYPNPFNPTTTIRFDVPASGQVTLAVFNMLGQQVATLVNEELTAGTYRAEFNSGSLASGAYFYRLATTGFSQTRKMVVMK